jgi:hypothetical protein
MKFIKDKKTNILVDACGCSLANSLCTIADLQNHIQSFVDSGALKEEPCDCVEAKLYNLVMKLGGLGETIDVYTKIFDSHLDWVRDHEANKEHVAKANPELLDKLRGGKVTQEEVEEALGKAPKIDLSKVH